MLHLFMQNISREAKTHSHFWLKTALHQAAVCWCVMSVEPLAFHLHKYWLARHPHGRTHSLSILSGGQTVWVAGCSSGIRLLILSSHIHAFHLICMRAHALTRSGMRNWRNPLLSLRVRPRRRAFVITFGAASENSSSLILTISITIDSYTTLLCALVSQRGCFRHPIAARGQIHAWSDSSLP